ncbi:MAG: translation initiation factor IF-2, partial [Thermoleophilaceae bacterium]|nr:translation initiation factor IF-2 [Thermoleophilaceae bacterium]
ANLGDLGVPKVSQAPSPSDPPPTKAPPETKPHPQRTFEPDEAPKPAESSPKPAASPAKPAASTSKPAASRPPASGGAGAGKMRRVVIDSQASRRGAPGPPPAGAGKGGRRSKGGRRRRPLFEEPVVEVVEEIEPSKVVVQIKSGSSVKEVSEFLGMPASDLIKKLMELGEMATLTQTLSDEAIGVLAESFERNVEIVSVADENVIAPLDSAEEEAASIERPPVVTIMGHVDHGKTSLLDAIRRTEVAAGEAGGITQHIGAYQVHHNDKLVTFIDTPGHEAFTAMRARGAKVTDIAVIVVAADDGMKPQTEEALDHAKAAGVPTVIAVNKIDKEGADPQKVRSELAKLGLTPEDWGGETIFCDVSAKTGEGLDHLLDMLQLVAEVEELKGNPDADATGTVIESKLDSGRGPVVSLLIQRGQLMAGQAMVAGPTWGRVRAMHDHTGANLKHAEIGMPVEVLGFDSVPAAGEVFRVVKNDREARQLAGDRANRLKTEAIARNRRRKVSLEDVFAQVGEGSLKNLNLVVKGDVAGSVGALEDEFAKLPQSEVQVNVIHRGVGGITESDVMLASASDAVVIGFNVRPVGDSRLLADKERVEIRTYNVIYKVIEELRSAMQGLLDPEEIEDAVGSATVRQVFKASKVGTIAGAHVEDGKLTRGATVRLVRDGTVVYEGKLDSLKRFNDDVREVAIGHECGVVLENFADVKEGDVIEAYSMRSVERELA